MCLRLVLTIFYNNTVKVFTMKPSRILSTAVAFTVETMKEKKVTVWAHYSVGPLWTGTV